MVDPRSSRRHSAPAPGLLRTASLPPGATSWSADSDDSSLYSTCTASSCFSEHHRRCPFYCKQNASLDHEYARTWNSCGECTAPDRISLGCAAVLPNTRALAAAFRHTRPPAQPETHIQSTNLLQPLHLRLSSTHHGNSSLQGITACARPVQHRQGRQSTAMTECTAAFALLTIATGER